MDSFNFSTGVKDKVAYYYITNANTREHYTGNVTFENDEHKDKAEKLVMREGLRVLAALTLSETGKIEW